MVILWFRIINGTKDSVKVKEELVGRQKIAAMTWAGNVSYISFILFFVVFLSYDSGVVCFSCFLFFFLSSR